MTLEKDKEDQSKYYLSYPNAPVLDMKWENRDINVVKWANIPKVAFSTKWRLGENVALRLMECLTPWNYYYSSYYYYSSMLTPSVSLTYLWITISHLFVCFPTLKLSTLEQQVCSTKIGYANALGTNSCKKRNAATLNSAHQAKKRCNIDSGWL